MIVLLMDTYIQGAFYDKKSFVINYRVYFFRIRCNRCIFTYITYSSFLLLSSFCFIKSSKRISIWFENTNIYKKHVRSFKENKAMTLKTKLYILIPVYVMLITLFFIKDILAMRIAIVVLLVVKTIVFIKIKTLKEA